MERNIQIVSVGKSFNWDKESIKEEGLEMVAEFESSFTALSWAWKHTADAFLVDLDSFGLKGIQVVNALRKADYLSKATFLLVGTIDDEDLIKTAQIAGVDDIIPYNFDEKALAEKVALYHSFKTSQEYTGTDVKSLPSSDNIKRRIFDVVVASLLLLLVSPIILLATVAIRIESKGKVYYTSKRVGNGYQIFDFLKLRSMYSDADKRLKDFTHLNQYSEETIGSDKSGLESDKVQDSDNSNYLYGDESVVREADYLKEKHQSNQTAFVKIDNDPRVTRVGKFIRKTSIDELPQLINVIRGDMSIVGNRPLPLYEAESLMNDDDCLRFFAPAGITGLWQVEKRGRTSKMSPEERKSLDNRYALENNFWFDIALLLRTIPAVFQKENV